MADIVFREKARGSVRSEVDKVKAAEKRKFVETKSKEAPTAVDKAPPSAKKQKTEKPASGILSDLVKTVKEQKAEPVSEEPKSKPDAKPGKPALLGNAYWMDMFKEPSAFSFGKKRPAPTPSFSQEFQRNCKSRISSDDQPKKLVVEEPQETEEQKTWSPLEWSEVFLETTNDFKSNKRLAKVAPSSTPLSAELIDQTKGEPENGMSISVNLNMEEVFIDEEGTFKEGMLKSFLVSENLEDCLCVDERTGRKSRLDVSRKYMNGKRVKKLTWALKHGLPITSLDMSYCPDLVSKNYRLVEAATEGGFLEVLSLEGCDLTDKHAEALAPALEKNNLLIGLDLTGNRITESGGMALMQAIENRNMDGWLRLSGNDVGDRVKERLEAFYLNGRMDMQRIHDISTSMM